MVKFGVNYAAHINLDLDAYVNYDLLKRKVHEYEDMHNQNKPVTKSKDSKWERKPNGKGEMKGSSFSDVFKEELGRVDEKYRSALRGLDYDFVEVQRLAKLVTANKKAGNKIKKQEAALKRFITNLYNKTIKLETSRVLNKTAIIKIVKKHDKVSRRVGQAPLFDHHMSLIDAYQFGNGRSLIQMQASLEQIYTDVFCDGMAEEARGKLRLAKGGANEGARAWIYFKAGILATLIFWTANEFMFSPRVSAIYITTTDPSVFVYSVVASLISFRWIWAFAVFMWERAQIDYILLLDLDASKHALTSEQIVSEAATYSIFFFCNLLAFHCIRMLDVYTDPASKFTGMLSWLSSHVYIMPVLLVAGTLISLVGTCMQPTSYGVFSTRIFMQLFQVPFTDVQLRHTFAADILTSFTKVMSGTVYSACYFSSGAFLQAGSDSKNYGADRFETCHSDSVHYLIVTLYCLPLLMRVLQNVRQQYDSYQRNKNANSDSKGTLSHLQKLRSKKISPSPASTTGEQNAITTGDSDEINDSTTAVSTGVLKQAHSRTGVNGSATTSVDVIGDNAEVLAFDNDLISDGEHSSDDHTSLEDIGANGRNEIHQKVRQQGHTRAGAHCSDAEDNCTERYMEGNSAEVKHAEAQEQDGVDEYDLTALEGGVIDLSEDPAAALRTDGTGSPKGVLNEGITRRSNSNIDTTGKGLSVNYHTEPDSKVGNVDNIALFSVAAGDTNSDSEQLPINVKPSKARDSIAVQRVGAGRLSRSESFSLPAPGAAVAVTKVVSMLHLPKWLIVWPYTFNMTRYLLSMCVVLLGAFPPTDPTSYAYASWYIPLSVLSTAYNIYWDVFVDWKLVQNIPPLTLLRDQNALLYGDVLPFYYVVMVTNACLRSMWTLAFTPYGGHPMLVMFELLRRGLWACLRMEVAYNQELQSRSKVA